MDTDQAGDPGRTTAVVRLYDRHGQELLRIAYLLTSDPSLAEELVQETFVRAWRAWGQLRSRDAARAWLRVTLVNLARRSLRRRLHEWHGRLARHDGVEALEVAVPERDLALQVDLERVVAMLPMRRRACVVLRYYADLSEQETATALGISVGTVKSSTHRALRQLGRILDADTPRSLRDR